jgi:hypothetical protein
MDAPSLPMHIGVPLDQLSFLFFGSLGVAIWLLYLYCEQQFAKRLVTENSDYIYQLLPRQLATDQEYSRGFLIYFMSMAAIVVLLALLGPQNLETLGITLPRAVSYLALPLAIAFVLMGALPNVPGLMLIEKYLRQYAHERAYIPDAARATAERLAAAEFDFTSYQGEALQSAELRGVDPGDFTRSRQSVEYNWARLCCLVYLLKSYRMSGLTDLLDAGLLRDYENDLDLIESKKKSMEDQMAAYRTAKASDRFYANDTLHGEIADNLYKLYILLGCAVRLKMQPHDDLGLVLRPFGLKLNRATPEGEMGDLKLICLFAVAVSVAAVGLAAYGLGQLGLWGPSPVFPQTIFQPFVDTAATLVPYATAIVIADLMRRHAIKNESWFGSLGHGRLANGANYVRVALVCGIAGYVALVIFGLTQQGPTPDFFKMEAPSALLAMVTGGFYVYHLDNAELGRRPSRKWELGSQTILTGLCGFIADCATWQIIFGTASAAIDRIILATVINASVGFVLAWYIPEAAAATLYDPLADARGERLSTLQSAARARLGNADSVIWLDKPHPALGNRSPRIAATTDVDGFERAIGLLEGPRALSA